MRNSSKYDEYKDLFKNTLGYYVYAWANRDWGNIYFYIGKGKNDRGSSMAGRSRAFLAITNNWDCYPVLIRDNLAEEEAYQLEEELKERLLFDGGFPIMDGEYGSGLKILKKRITQANDIKSKQKKYNKVTDINIMEFVKIEKTHSTKESREIFNITNKTYMQLLRIAYDAKLIK